jgi:hypothetical protein
MRIAPRYVLTVAALLARPTAPLACQDNVLDLRVVEVNSHHDVTYQNFIYARSLAGGKYLAQALYLRLPGIKYNEVAVGAGLRIASFGDASAYIIAGVGSATDANYAEPALLVQDTKGRLTYAVFFQRYVPLNNTVTVPGQWLIDPLEIQYAVYGPLYLGAALYAFKPGSDAWLTKVGPKLGVNDKFGSTEVRMTSVSQGGGHQVQLRRIVVF